MGSEEVLDQAVTWVARLRADDVTVADKGAFSRWLTASEENKEAFDHTLSLWAHLEVVGQLPFDDLTQKTRRGRSGAFQFYLLTLAATVVLVVSVITSIFISPTYETEVGEQATLTLADGSVLDLNTDTAVNVDFSADERAIDLISGEAFFEVRQDLMRPFVVAACDCTIIAVGTAFNVHCEGGNLTVTVSEGQVKVVSNGTSEILSAKQQLTLLDSQLQPIRKVNTDNVTAWRRQLHIYDGVPLSAVVADLNRYASQKIRVFDTDLAKIEVVARYKMTDRETTLSSLEKTFSLRVVIISDDEIALMPL